MDGNEDFKIMISCDHIAAHLAVEERNSEGITCKQKTDGNGECHVSINSHQTVMVISIYQVMIRSGL